MSLLDSFTESWERGEGARVEGYVGLLSPEEEAELVYHEYCLAESSGLAPDPSDYLGRFPQHADTLARLFDLHAAVSASSLRRWVEPVDLPEAGCSIGPYSLLRELGRGAFARVFLAEQADLADRLVVVKVSTRRSAEPELLARARHAHIVEVLRQAEADDGALHLVCMPFLGGSTLAGVLDARRKLERRPRSGLDFLADLDRASAPEFPRPGTGRPAREAMSRSTYAEALAWVVARLAEALEHARVRGVTHGDLKPSNILLTADGTPMLFDFNLAVDWHDAAESGPAPDAGGTLAYMAPERLRSVAGEAVAGPVRPIDRHRADLYGLGLVLLEALTGNPPEVPARRLGDVKELASTIAESRREVPGAISDRSVPAGLRPILRRCLAPDPADRHADGAELARDLDHWRDIRARKQAPRVAVAVTAIAAFAAAVVAPIAMQGTGREQALAKLSALIDRPESGPIVVRPPGLWALDDPGEDPAEVADRNLAAYDVSKDTDWRDREDVRSLPEADRQELEAWLLEQVLRRAVALGDRPASPEDWWRALSLLDRAVAKAPLSALLDRRAAIREQLGLAPSAPPPSTGAKPPSWLESYLHGVAAEPLHAREALGHYLDTLRARPGLFWAEYRASLALSRLDECRDAIAHLLRCLDRRPNNAALHVQFAALIHKVERDTPSLESPPWPLGLALDECNLALKLAPDYAPALAARSRIRRASGQPEGAEEDVDRLAILTRHLGKVEILKLRARSRYNPGPNYGKMHPANLALAKEAVDAAPGDVDARSILATGLARLGRAAEALAEYDRVLEADPGHLPARYQKALQLHQSDRPAAVALYRAVIDDPRFEELLRNDPLAIRAFHYVATDCLERGRLDEARAIAFRGLDHARRSASLRTEMLKGRAKDLAFPDIAPRGETYYLLARIEAEAAKADRSRLSEAADHLATAFQCTESLRKSWFVNDRRFDASRDDILAILARKPTDR